MSIIIYLSQLGKFWQESLNQKIFRLNLLILVFELSYLFLKFNSLPPQVPLFYSLPWGESRLTSTPSLFLLPGFTLVIVLVDNIIASSFSHSSILFSRLLVVFSLIFSALTLVSLVQIISLVT